MYDCPNDMLMQQKKFASSLLPPREAADSQIKHGLTTEALTSYPPLINAEAERFFTEELHLTPSSPGPFTCEAFKAMSKLIILTASRALQGKEVRDSLNSEFAQYFHDLDAGFTPINFMFPNLPLPSYRKRDKAQQAMSDFYLSIMKKRREGSSEVRRRQLHSHKLMIVGRIGHAGRSPRPRVQEWRRLDRPRYRPHDDRHLDGRPAHILGHIILGPAASRAQARRCVGHVPCR